MLVNRRVLIFILIFIVCRALGLPCRNVTNYLSAHDTNKSMTVDKFVNEEGEETTISEVDGVFNEASPKDSIWNFHVWNEVWMSREDLPDSIYNGWQVIDATPQEESEGEQLATFLLFFLRYFVHNWVIFRVFFAK